ncbi:MAG TPA: hypothetical protein VIM61_02700 [Chthoniobacterales bacterium]
MSFAWVNEVVEVIAATTATRDRIFMKERGGARRLIPASPIFDQHRQVSDERIDFFEILAAAFFGLDGEFAQQRKHVAEVAKLRGRDLFAGSFCSDGFPHQANLFLDAAGVGKQGRAKFAAQDVEFLDHRFCGRGFRRRGFHHLHK